MPLLELNKNECLAIYHSFNTQYLKLHDSRTKLRKEVYSLKNDNMYGDKYEKIESLGYRIDYLTDEIEKIVNLQSKLEHFQNNNDINDED